MWLHIRFSEVSGKIFTSIYVQWNLQISNNLWNHCFVQSLCVDVFHMNYPHELCPLINMDLIFQGYIVKCLKAKMGISIVAWRVAIGLFTQPNKQRSCVHGLKAVTLSDIRDKIRTRTCLTFWEIWPGLDIQFRITSWNIQGLNKYEDCKDIITFLLEFDIIDLCETWAKYSGEFDSFLNNSVHFDCVRNFNFNLWRNSGGVSIFIKKRPPSYYMYNEF